MTFLFFLPSIYRREVREQRKPWRIWKLQMSWKQTQSLRKLWTLQRQSKSRGQCLTGRYEEQASKAPFLSFSYSLSLSLVERLRRLTLYFWFLFDCWHHSALAQLFVIIVSPLSFDWQREENTLTSCLVWWATGALQVATSWISPTLLCGAKPSQSPITASRARWEKASHWKLWEPFARAQRNKFLEREWEDEREGEGEKEKERLQWCKLNLTNECQRAF